MVCPVLRDKSPVTVDCYLLANTSDVGFHRKARDTHAWSQVIDQTDRKTVNGLYLDGIESPERSPESLDTLVP